MFEKIGRLSFDEALEALAESEASSEAEAVRFEFLEKTADRILKSFDPENGGLLGAPKFPNPTVFTFLRVI
jgi:uncharacterized protein YyaL (SSP411 family)